MKGRSFIAIFLTILALLITSFPGFSKTSHRSIKSSAGSGSADARYSVRKGDNLTMIAGSWGTTPEALQSANGLRSSRIKVGQVLVIPGRAAVEPVEAARPAANTAETFTSAPSDTGENLEQAARPEEHLPARLRLVQAGFQLLGVRYRFSGISEKSGLDCSGLVKILFSKFDIEVPRSSREQFRQGQEVERNELEPGDLVFFSSGGSQPTHVGIYVGDNKFLHAARKARRVIVSDLNKIWYAMRYLGARRVTDLWEQPVAVQP